MTFTIVTTIIDVASGQEQVVSREAITAGEWAEVYGDTISAARTGSEPGQPYRVELVTAAPDGERADVVIDSYETIAD